MSRTLALPVFLTALALNASMAHAQRAIGIDVSYWQSNNANPTQTIINWANVAKPIAQGGGGIQFAFIRSSRGGTTGTTTSAGGANTGTLSQRYDDPYFEDNMNDAKANGILSGPYHYARPDIATNTGLDEANHFLEKAGAYMKPGWFRPVLDLEQGETRTTADLTNWALEFSDRIFAVKGVRPIIYCNINYANQVDSRINVHDLWMARYFSTGTPDPFDPSVQNAIDPPPSGSTNTYGAWAPGYPSTPYPTPRPWDFWQYGSTGTCPGISGNVDRNIANGDMEFVKDFLVPANWNVNADGDWSTASNWNSETYLPAANDRVIINRTAGVYNITLNTGNHSIRSLQLNEPMEMNGGSLNIAQYANLANLLTMNDGTFTSASMSHTTTLTMNGGTVTTGDQTGNGILLAYGGEFVARSVRLGTVNLSGGSIRLTGVSTSVMTSITQPTATGSVNVGGAKLVINYAGTSPIGTIRNLIRRGFASGAWTGQGIRSDQLTDATGLAYVEASAVLSPTGGSWGGITVDGTSILISKALRGDANVNGTVDFADLLALVQSYDAAGTWINGDGNYDGLIDFNDVLIVAQNYGSTLLSDGSIHGNSSADFSSDWVLARSIVPEPASLSALAVLTPFTRRRRR